MRITRVLSPRRDLGSAENFALGEKFECFREARSAGESIRAVRSRAYHVVIIDAGRCRHRNESAVLARRITDADERSLITLAVRILSLALDARRGSLDRLYARTPRRQQITRCFGAADSPPDRSNYLKLQQLPAEQ